jgi:hypothetical protein
MTVSFWHTDELHVAKLLAVKRTVVTVSKWPLCIALHNGHYVECPVMNSGITASMAAAVLSRRSHAQALHNYKVFRNSSKESVAW